MSVVIGFDLGKAFGWSVIQTNGTVQEYGTSYPEKGESSNEIGVALNRFYKEVRRLLAANEPDLVVIAWEYVQFNRGRGGKYNDEMRGVLRLLCERRGIPYLEVGVPALKRFATGKGNAKKDEMRAAAGSRMMNPPEDENAVDALWVGWWALDTIKNEGLLQ